VLAVFDLVSEGGVTFEVGRTVVFNSEGGGGVDVLAITVTVTVVVLLAVVMAVTSELGRRFAVSEVLWQLLQGLRSPDDRDPGFD
jgi:hypothetical protein